MQHTYRWFFLFACLFSAVLFGTTALPPAVVAQDSTSEHSVARQWNEVLLNAIRNDFARPTVHARNLFHVSAAMYDAWTVFDGTAGPYFLGKTVRQFPCAFDGFQATEAMEAARAKAISHAAYRILSHRFSRSPGADESLPKFDSLLSFAWLRCRRHVTCVPNRQRRRTR